MIEKTAKVLFCVLLAAAVLSVFSVTVFAAGDVAGAIENTWNAAKGQIQTVVNLSLIHIFHRIAGRQNRNS